MKIELKWTFLAITALLGSATQPASAAMPMNALSRYVGLYENSNGTPLLHMILSAQSLIQIEIYEMKDHDVLNALRAALSRGVRIEVVQEPEPVGAKCQLFAPPMAGDDADCQNGKQFIRQVIAHRGVYVPFNKDQLCGKASFPGEYCFEHGKLLIVDRQIAMVSTGNFNSTNLCSLDQSPSSCNRDYSVVTDDSTTLQVLEGVFARDVAGQSFDLSPVLAPGLRQRMTVSPLASAPLLEFISAARASIEIENQYLNEPILNQALIAAAKRGVKVYVTLASPCSFEKPSAKQLARLGAQFTEFEQAGIDTRFFTGNFLVDGRRGYLHAKAIVVDGEAAWVGSNNGSATSFFRNREYGLFFNFSKWVIDLTLRLETDHNDQHGTESWRDGLACRFDPPPMQGDG